MVEDAETRQRRRHGAREGITQREGLALPRVRTGVRMDHGGGRRRGRPPAQPEQATTHRSEEPINVSWPHVCRFDGCRTRAVHHDRPPYSGGGHRQGRGDTPAATTRPHARGERRAHTRAATSGTATGLDLGATRLRLWTAVAGAVATATANRRGAVSTLHPHPGHASGLRDL